jgi:hypothetical protein
MGYGNMLFNENMTKDLNEMSLRAKRRNLPASYYLVSTLSGSGWGFIAWYMGSTWTTVAILPTIAASSLIGLIIGSISRGFNQLSSVGRIRFSLLTLYFGVTLFAISMGIFKEFFHNVPGRDPGGTIFNILFVTLYGLTFTGPLLVLWPLAYANHCLLCGDKKVFKKLFLFFSIGLLCFLVFRVYERRDTRCPDRYLVPMGYVGWVKIIYNDKDSPPLPIENGCHLVRIPTNGVLKTSSKIECGNANDEYYYYSENTRQVIEQTVDETSRLIWDGAIGGEGKEENLIFFFGTKTQCNESRLKGSPFE